MKMLTGHLAQQRLDIDTQRGFEGATETGDVVGANTFKLGFNYVTWNIRNVGKGLVDERPDLLWRIALGLGGPGDGQRSGRGRAVQPREPFS